jgi:Outer membrane protein beta-barrel domain
MKRVLLILITATASLFCQAQDFKPFRVGLGPGFASPSGEGTKVGYLLFFEPSYRINNAITIGTRFEFAAMARGGTAVKANGLSADIKLSRVSSYTLSGQYYFLDNRWLRPFAGFGLGFYKLGSIKAQVSSGGNAGSTNYERTISGSSKVGFYPRIGFDLWHFIFSIEYNIIPPTKSVFTTTSGTGATTTTIGEIKNNYFAIKTGIFFGGGKRL